MQNTVEGVLMTEAWHEGVPEDALKTEADKAYEQAAVAIRDGLGRGLGFDAACAGIETQNNSLRAVIIDDMLKVLIAENHFARGIALEDLARELKVDVQRLDDARQSMMREIEETAIREYHRSLPPDNA
jgi:hypothetical protein